MIPDHDPTRLPRRTVLKWFAAATAAMHLPELGTTATAVEGYGTDPDTAKFYQPGDFWPLTFTPAQRRTVTALADLILPADHFGPAASAVRVPDYLDEWVSAPYEEQQQDRATLLPGLEWLEAEAQRRFRKDFAALREEEMRAICDDICGSEVVPPQFKKAAAFFKKFRSLAAGAYYGTEAGWKALGYIGNVPLVTFDGPPPEVLAQLGLEQTVK